MHTLLQVIQYYIPDIGDIPRNAGIAFSPGISGISSMPVNRGRADIPVVSDDISVPSSMLLFLKAELDEADDDEEKKEAVEKKGKWYIVVLCLKYSVFI